MRGKIWRVKTRNGFVIMGFFSGKRYLNFEDLLKALSAGKEKAFGRRAKRSRSDKVLYERVSPVHKQELNIFFSRTKGKYIVNDCHGHLLCSFAPRDVDPVSSGIFKKEA